MEESNVTVGIDYKNLNVNIDAALLKNSVFIGRASGRSMEGVGIFDGDLLIIDRALTAKHGDVIVAIYNGQFVCKIADMINNRLLSASDEYPPIKITQYDEYNIEGVVPQSIRIFREPIELKQV